jgi:hypothetical protein
MKRLLAAAVALAALSGVAALASGAQANKLNDASIAVKPGMWEWKQETSILGLFNAKETNLECLIPEKAQITLSRLASDLDEGCRVENVAKAESGYTFKLVCRGDVSGTADSRLTGNDTSMSLRAKGSARWGILVAGLSMKADASYKGECTVEEAARQKAKWEQEQARGG